MLVFSDVRQRAAVAQDEYFAVTCGRSVIWSCYHVMCGRFTEFCEFYDYLCRTKHNTHKGQAPMFPTRLEPTMQKKKSGHRPKP
jgi:hypothetical protein